MGLTSGIAKLISLAWITLIAWSIDRVSKLETDEAWEPARAERPTRTLPFEGVALAGTAHADDLGGEAFAHASVFATRPEATVNPAEWQTGEPTRTLIAGAVVDRVLPALLEYAPIHEPPPEPAVAAEAPSDPVVAVGPADENSPADDMEAEASSESAVANAVPARAPSGPRTYRVIKGDTLNRIVKREFGASDSKLLKAIFEANPGLKQNPNRLHAGSDLQLPEWPAGAALRPAPAVTARS